MLTMGYNEIFVILTDINNKHWQFLFHKHKIADTVKKRFIRRP